MKLIKMILISCCLLQATTVLPSHNPESIKKKLLKKFQTLPPATTSVRSIAIPVTRACIVFGICTYIDLVIQGPQDFTKFPNFSTKNFSSYWENLKISLHNTKRSLMHSTMEKEHPITTCICNPKNDDNQNHE